MKLDSLKLSHVHLGDMVNIIQSNRDKNLGVFCDDFCKCCSFNPQDTLNFLLSIFDTRLFYKISYNYKKICPTWEKGERCPSYSKMNNLHSIESHVVCHFDPSSGHHYKDIGNIKFEIINSIGKDNVINIGKFPIEGVSNKHDAPLSDKVKYISSAAMVIGIDDGIAHLAETTNSRNIIIKMPNHEFIYKMYPPQAEIIDVGNILDVI